MFIDLSLRTLEKKEMELALLGAGFYFEETGGLFKEDSFVDIIGVVYKEVGEEIFIKTPGWHVNVRTQNPEVVKALESVTIHPQTPNRVWA